jgi:ubiquinone/menaquinone biosynthesis C-methylase UbiE
VAGAIIREVSLSKDMDVLDFGCGTGLVTLRLQPLVGTITGADSSPGMLAILEEKIRAQELTNIRTVFVDFEKGDRIGEKFHLIVCSMTLHHVPDTAALFRLWHEMLLPGGHLCLADLDTEDDSFHSDKTGVFHLGFDRERLRRSLHETGFSEVRDTTATTMSRDIAGKGKRDFPVFLIVARKL